MVGGNTRGNVQFGTPDRGKGVAMRAEQGRICDHDGCSTILSTYNTTGTCWTHTGATFRPRLAHAPASP